MQQEASPGLLNPLTGAVGGATGLLSPVTDAVGAASELLNPSTGAIGGSTGLLNLVVGLTGGLTGTTGSSLTQASGPVSGLLGGLGLSAVGGAVSNLPLVGSLSSPLGTTNLQSESSTVQSIANNLPTNQGSFVIQDVPTLIASLGSGRYLTSVGTVINVPQEAQGLVRSLGGGNMGSLGGSGSGVQSEAGGLAGHIRSQLGGVTSGLDSQLSNAASGAHGELGGAGNIQQGITGEVARYIQIAGQAVPERSRSDYRPRSLSSYRIRYRELS